MVVLTRWSYSQGSRINEVVLTGGRINEVAV